jgi:O-acetyl-ADP-ribose deacetylase
MVRRREREEREQLRDAYLNSMELAEENHLRSISFPSISTGIYRFPLDEAANIAVSTIEQFLETSTHIEEVRMILFNYVDLEAYQKANEKKNQ